MYTTKTTDLGHHKDELRHRQILRGIFILSSFIFILILILLVMIFILLSPTKVTKPRFTVEDASVLYGCYDLSSTGTTDHTLNNLTTTMNVTLSAFNPNILFSIYYQKLEAYASYHGHKISLPTELPATTYQGVWSLLLNGTDMPVLPDVLKSLEQDAIAKETLVNVMVNGSFKWKKLGTFYGGSYHIDVNCSVYMILDDGGGKNNATVVEAPAPAPAPTCDVTIFK